MKHHLHIPADAKAYTHVIRPRKGKWQRVLLNTLLRTTVKSQLGQHVDISALRNKFHKLNQQAAREVRHVQRDAVECNGVAAEWLSDGNVRPNRVLLYLHGGAFVTHMPEVYTRMVATWCRALNARALMVNYRLAPEHPYPAATDECYRAYCWLLSQGVKGQDIVIAGDSAGGNLVLATLLGLKHENRPLPSCAVLLSPFLDLTLSGHSILGNTRHDPMFTHAFAIGIRSIYAPPDQHTHPSVSPLFGDFTGLPPMLLQVSSTELLLDDSVRAAAKAKAAGVDVRLEIWESLPHVFQMHSMLPQTHDASRNIRDFIGQHAGWSR